MKLIFLLLDYLQAHISCNIFATECQKLRKLLFNKFTVSGPFGDTPSSPDFFLILIIMNNKFIALFAATIICSIIACAKKTVYSNSGTKKQNDKTLTDTLWNLKNRIPNCDSAIVFMKHVIVPVESFPKIDNLLPRDRETIVTIPGEDKELQEDEKYKFYINPDCLIGKPAEIALEIFCVKDSLESFIVLDKKFQAEDTFWVLSARGFGNYLSIRFEKGLVSSAVFNVVSKSH